jgi:hypothetical protein
MELSQPMEASPEVRAYMAEIGRNGGSRSKRKLSRKEARRMALVRWAHPKPKPAQHLITANA